MFCGVTLRCVQVERGTTATFLSSDGDNSVAMSRLVVIRRRTDRLVGALSRWPTHDGGLIVSGNVLQNKRVSSIIRRQEYDTIEEFNVDSKPKCDHLNKVSK